MLSVEAMRKYGAELNELYIQIVRKAAKLLEDIFECISFCLALTNIKVKY